MNWHFLPEYSVCSVCQLLSLPLPSRLRKDGWTYKWCNISQDNLNLNPNHKITFCPIFSKLWIDSRHKFIITFYLLLLCSHIALHRRPLDDNAASYVLFLFALFSSISGPPLGLYWCCNGSHMIIAANVMLTKFRVSMPNSVVAHRSAIVLFEWQRC